jgi:membrane protease YdiL (CAAX protease family)
LPGIDHPVTDASPALRATLADFAAFLRRPQVLAPEGWRAPGNLARWGWLTVTLVAGLVVVMMPFLQLWQNAFDLPEPDAFGKMPEHWLVPAVVLVAPVIEELLFRGWQRGRASALWLLGCALIGTAVLLLGAAINPLLMLGALIAALLGGAIGWWRLRRKSQPLGWFSRSFPAIFYLTAALFALIHLSNYPQASLLAVPLVLPQLWAGLMLGYVRQRLGLLAAIASHVTANACSLGLAYMLS